MAIQSLRLTGMLAVAGLLAALPGRTHAGTSYWNRFDAPARDFNTAGNWVGGVPGASDTAAFTNWGNNFTLTWSAPTVNKDAIFDAVNLTREIRPGGTGSAAWTVTNSMRVGNSVANLGSMAMYAQQIAVTNSSGTAKLYVNWGTGAGRGRIFLWSQNASLIADHIYATNHYAWSGLDVINLGTLTTRGDSEFAILVPATPTTFYMANWGGAVARWNILGGTSKMAQDMNLGSPGIYGWGAAGTCTAVVSVAGSTARLLAARSVALNTAGAGVGLLTVSSGGYARISGLLRVGWSGGSMGNTVKVTGPNSKLKTDNQVYVYSFLSGNSIQIEKGGTWEHNAANALYFLGAGSSTNNRVVIDGPGSSFTYNDMYIGGGAGVQHGKGWLIIQNGARASSLTDGTTSMWAMGPATPTARSVWRETAVSSCTGEATSMSASMALEPFMSSRGDCWRAASRSGPTARGWS